MAIHLYNNYQERLYELLHDIDIHERFYYCQNQLNIMLKDI